MTNKTIILITVDTELSTHKEDFGILGNVGGKKYGLPKFLEVLKAKNMKATFFIDVYSSRAKHLPLMRSLCEELKSADHDLQLHTHPDGIFDPQRGQMQQYSLKDQIEIIRKGKQLFEEWFRQTPMVHRAGDWGANADTLEALIANNILCDSSMFHSWHHCGLNQAPFTRNRIARYKSLTEIPATCYQTPCVGIFHPIRLLSTDGNSLAETIELIKKVHLSGAGFVNLVYHSFSFLRWNKTRTEYGFDRNRLVKFEGLLDFLNANESFEVKTIKELFYLTQENDAWFQKPDVITANDLGATALRLIDRLKGN